MNAWKRTATLYRSGQRETVRLVAFCIVFLIISGIGKRGLAGESASELRFQQLEAKLGTVLDELAAVKSELAAVKGSANDTAMKTLPSAGHHSSPRSTLRKLHFGGYGEMHVNANPGRGGQDQFDLHRQVIDVGYDFSKRIRFQSEIEIEHAFVESGNGELSIEQAYIEFEWKKAINFRVGRILAPIGIINRWHEPTRFNGVERPTLNKVIIPTTWSVDGGGIFGDLGSTLKYEVYLVGGLDASRFNALDGIRKGRIEENASLNDMAVTGRLDWYPLITRAVPHNQTLRLGISGYSGGADNGNKGNNPSINSALRIYSLDADYRLARLAFRGVLAHEFITNANNAPAGTAEEIFGWNLEVAYHWFPKRWQRGELKHANSAVFVRYDDINTQAEMPSGRTANPRGDRQEWTVGVSFWPRANLVLKADYQFKGDASNNTVDDQFNLGVGWQF